jgi:aspartate/methionine/tyrosine aminotransferase
MQTWGLAKGFGGTIKQWRLVEDRAAGRWRADVNELETLVTPKTKLIVICNPNNPTGARLTASELDAIAKIADRNGSWILSDEVYRGAELDGIETGDEVVFMLPNYNQIFGLGRAFGGTVKGWPLARSGATGKWAADIDALQGLVTPKTKLIAICNPNNPTGARLEEPDLDRIAAIAGRHGSWILADEIYRGAERDGRETPAMWGRSDRVIITSGLSKAYGLPGLRVGWIVAPPERIASCWQYHDYTTIAPGALSDALARRALEPSRRHRLLARTRRIINDNFAVVAEWLDGHAEWFDYTPPDAGAIVWVRLRRDGARAADFVEDLRRRKSVLLVPGDHFGMPGYIRIGFGSDAGYVARGLQRVHEFLEEA